MKIKDLEIYERPREKAKRFGIASLDTCEIIALILGSGVKNCSAIDIGRIMLSKYSLKQFPSLDFQDLRNEKGFKEPTIWRFLAVLELHKRINRTLSSSMIKIEDKTQLIHIYMGEFCSLRQEVVVIVMLNSHNYVIHEEIIFKGGSNQVTFTSGDVFRSLLREGATKFYILHNHPGGSSMPSKNDVNVTVELLSLCKQVGLKLIDHIIFSYHDFYSFKDSNLI